MKTIFSNKLANLNPNLKSITIIFSACLLVTGCGGFGKNKNTEPVKLIQPTVINQLASPSLTYLSDPAIEIDNNRTMTADRWMSIAQSNYQAKKYARALRAATEALNLDEQLMEARELALLSAVKVTETNISAYHDNVLMSDYDKAELKVTLADITSLINTSE